MSDMQSKFLASLQELCAPLITTFSLPCPWTIESWQYRIQRLSPCSMLHARMILWPLRENLP